MTLQRNWRNWVTNLSFGYTSELEIQEAVAIAVLDTISDFSSYL